MLIIIPLFLFIIIKLYKVYKIFFFSIITWYYLIKFIKLIKNSFEFNKFNLSDFLKNINLSKKPNNLNSNNIQTMSFIQFIKKLILLILKVNFLIDINYKNLFDLKIKLLRLIEDSDTISSDEQDNKNKLIDLSLKYDDFNKVVLSEKIKYINAKMINKGIDPNQHLTEWFISAALKNTNGNQLEVDNFIEINLNILIKSQREAQLNTYAFERFKPFLMHKINQEPNNFPTVIPISKNISEYENQEFINVINKEKNINSIDKSKELNNKL
jgi:hypothetical protein